MDKKRAVPPDDNYFRYLSNDVAEIPEGVSAPLELKTAAEMMAERNASRSERQCAAIPEEFQRKPKPLDMRDWPFSEPNVFWNLRHWSSRWTRLKLIVWLIGTLPFAGQQLPKNNKHKM